MALETNEQYVAGSALQNQNLRIVAEEIKPKTFASGTGTLAAGTAVTYNTSTNLWQIFDDDGSNGTNALKGFVWPNAIELNASAEVVGNVMLRGEVHVDDIPIVDVAVGYDLAGLQGVLRSGARELGIKVQGLDQVR